MPEHSLSQLVFEQVDDELPSELWRASPDATIFTRPDVLRRFFEDVHWWVAVKKGKPVAAWPVPLDASGRPTSSGWFYFVGPIWVCNALPPPAHRALSGTVPIYTGFIDAFVETYGGFVASLPPTQTDVRAFTWWRYDEGAPIDVRPRYSARIDSLASRSYENLLAGMRQVRRYELRQDLSLGKIQWSSELSPEELTGIYLERVPGDAASILTDAERLLALIEDGAGFASVARDADGKVKAAIAALCDGVMANVVVNSVSADWRSTGLGVHNTVRALAHVQQIGLNSLDFNGANSPNRGDDKHSYGARPILYFDVEFFSNSQQS
jgi:hypothetical protein